MANVYREIEAELTAIQEKCPAIPGAGALRARLEAAVDSARALAGKVDRGWTGVHELPAETPAEPAPPAGSESG